MSAFTDAYVNLLIKQYWEKTKARGEIAAQAAGWEAIRDLMGQFGTQFDLDQAVGAQLDIIGKLVGISRYVRGVALTDDEYRFFIKVKIAVNTGSAYMVSDVRTSIQDVINTVFAGDAYVIDNKDMSLDLYIPASYDLNLLNTIIALGLLPKPQAVRYATIVQAIIGETFGFSDNPNSKGFANKDDLINEPGGVFALKVI